VRRISAPVIMPMIMLIIILMITLMIAHDQRSYSSGSVSCKLMMCLHTFEVFIRAQS